MEHRYDDSIRFVSSLKIGGANSLARLAIDLTLNCFFNIINATIIAAEINHTAMRTN